MEVEEILEISRQSIWILIKISAPVLLAALIVGVIISLFQALTQMQEATISFVPKIIAIFIVIILTLPFMTTTLKNFTEELSERMINPNSSP